MRLLHCCGHLLHTSFFLKTQCQPNGSLPVPAEQAVHFQSSWWCLTGLPFLPTLVYVSAAISTTACPRVPWCQNNSSWAASALMGSTSPNCRWSLRVARALCRCFRRLRCHDCSVVVYVASATSVAPQAEMPGHNKQRAATTRRRQHLIIRVCNYQSSTR